MRTAVRGASPLDFGKVKVDIPRSEECRDGAAVGGPPRVAADMVTGGPSEAEAWGTWESVTGRKVG